MRSTLAELDRDTRERLTQYAQAVGAVVLETSGEVVSVEFPDWVSVLDWCTYAALDAAERRPELVRLALELGTPSACLSYVQRQFEWRDEPGERLSYPTSTLARGWGDCDDLSVLLCSLISALGFQSAVVGLTIDAEPVHAVVGLRASSSSPDSHGQDGDPGGWWWLDPSEAGEARRWRDHPMAQDSRPGLRGIIAPLVVPVPRWPPVGRA